MVTAIPQHIKQTVIHSFWTMLMDMSIPSHSVEIEITFVLSGTPNPAR